MKYQVALNKNGKILDILVEANSKMEAKIITKELHPKSKVVGVYKKDD